jgi:chromosome segregation ATPase
LNKLKSSQQAQKKSRESAMKELENGVKSANKHASAVRADTNKSRLARDAFAAEVQTHVAEIHSLKEQLDNCEQTITQLTGSIEALTEKVLIIASVRPRIILFFFV